MPVFFPTPAIEAIERSAESVERSAKSIEHSTKVLLYVTEEIHNSLVKVGIASNTAVKLTTFLTGLTVSTRSLGQSFYAKTLASKIFFF